MGLRVRFAYDTSSPQHEERTLSYRYALEAACYILPTQMNHLGARNIVDTSTMSGLALLCVSLCHPLYNADGV
jgi:hypothetical protein